MDEKQHVAEQLHQARRRLLDLTLRNRMLNFRPTRRTTINIIEERPDLLWDLLAVQGRKLSFLAREEYEQRNQPQDDQPGSDDQPDLAKTEPIDTPQIEGASELETAPESPQAEPESLEALDTTGESFDLPELAAEGEEKTPGRLPKHYTDLLLQTDLSGTNLQTNLLRIAQAAESAIEERGVNLLFLALGFVLWKQPDDDRLLQAPLLLLPVELQRTSAKRRFRLAAIGDDPVLNPSLAAAWKRDWNIDLPQAPEDWQQFDPGEYYRKVREAIAPRDGWAVTDQVALGLFSFSKYLMYVDLDPDRWPGDDLVENPLIRAVTVGEQPEPAAERQHERQEDPPAESAAALAERFQVLDADSSQQAAIEAVKAGRSVVIEGPPGTGKSQTISNIIAETLAAGKTVLFVSEKLAALEVVKRRLDQVQLGDFCLELHSTKSNRKAVAAELARVLDKPRVIPKTDPRAAEKLDRLRQSLDDYVRALHEPVEQTHLSPHEAMGRVAQLIDVPDVLADLQAETFTADQLGQLQTALAELGRRGLEIWDPAEHPFRGARIAQVSAAKAREAVAKAESFRDAARSAAEAFDQLRRQLGAVAEPSAAMGEALVQAADCTLQSPQPPEELIGSDRWNDVCPAMTAAIELIRRGAEIQAWMEGKYQPELVAAADVTELTRRVADRSKGFWRWLSPGHWADRKRIAEMRYESYQPEPLQQLADLGKLAKLEGICGDLAAQDRVLAGHFGPLWQGIDQADLAGLYETAQWLQRFRRLVQRNLAGSAAIDVAAGKVDPGPLRQARDEQARTLAEWDRARREVVDLLELEDKWLDAQAEQVGFEQTAGRLEEMINQHETLHAWAAWQQSLQQVLAGPVGGWAAEAINHCEPELWALALEKQASRCIAEYAVSRREPLGQFNAAEHDSRRKQFARADVKYLSTTPLRLHGRLAESRPDGQIQAAPSSGLGIVLGEVRRKRGGRSIRAIFRDAGQVIRRIKPCLMMSPLSVAQFLDPASLRFDVVIFDEASQVEPADALGAIARGKQLVLVGDNHQLPPTTFFSAMGGEPTGSDAAAGLADMESILDRGEMTLPRIRLKWHYRSRHESLIAFSSAEFYDDQLVVFPSPHPRGQRLGLSAVYEPEDWYDRGHSGTNRLQAERIAEAVFDHAQAHPELSLGVGAFSKAQQQAILDAIETLRRRDDSLAGFFARDKAEPFFVKNLETIQGDERDVIFLSIGYGRSDPGERLSMNFGPLNQDGGWRRLNVLVTRARRRCVVFTSIRPEDFDLSATQARGVHALHHYLQHAWEATENRPAGSEEKVSAMESAVYSQLTERGYPVRRSVGPGRFGIDLAVCDPDDPQRCVLGIECDGKDYRAERTARDRDRLRQQVLEQPGWRVVRLWSVDFFRRPGRRIEKLIEAIEQARRGQLAPTFATIPTSEASRAKPVDSAGGDEIHTSLSQPYVLWSPDQPGDSEMFYTQPIDELGERVGQIVQTEGPVHLDEIARRLAAAFEISRVGSRVADRARRATETAARSGRIAVRGDFAWPAGMQTPPVRRRDDEALRDAGLLCPEEVAAAAMLLLESQYGMTREDLVSQTAHLLGFGLTGRRIAEMVEQTLDQQLQDGRLRVDEDGLLAPAGEGPAAAAD